MPTSKSHPTYAVMVVEAIRENGGKQVSRQGILKHITSKYGLEEGRANIQAKKTIKQLLEDKHIQMANVAGRKGAGSYKLPSKTAMMELEKAKVKASTKKVTSKAKEKTTVTAGAKKGKVAASRSKAGTAAAAKGGQKMAKKAKK